MLSFWPIIDRIPDYWPIVWLSSLSCKNENGQIMLSNLISSMLVQRIQSFKVKEFQSLIWFAVHGFFTSSFCFSYDHFSKTLRWCIMGPPFIWERNCVVILSDIYLIFWMLLLFSSSSIFTEAQALGCVWAGGIVLHSVWGLRGKRHRPKGL